MNKFVTKYKMNVKNPKNSFLGRSQLRRMNKHHYEMAAWGVQHISFADKTIILDVGCGGGKNIECMSEYAPHACLFGVDISDASIKMTKKLNRHIMKKGRLNLSVASVEKLPYKDNYFDLVTAFETVYFWNLQIGFKEVYRILQQGGTFLIVNEAQNDKGWEEYIATIGFTVYTAQQLEQNLLQAGFSSVKIDAHENGKWLAAVAIK